MIDSLAITAITNFLLACELFFLVGLFAAVEKERFSAAWYWQAALLLLALSALVGGIDHGFVEPLGDTPARRLLMRTNWLLLGLTTAVVLLTTARQFWSPRWQRPAAGVAVAQFLLLALLVVVVDRFIVVIANYAPVIVLLLAFSVWGLRNGRGSRAMVIGLTIMIAASLVQVLRVGVFYPLDHNGLYHLIAMVGVIFLYRGGLQLKTAVS